MVDWCIAYTNNNSCINENKLNSNSIGTWDQPSLPRRLSGAILIVSENKIRIVNAAEKKNK